MNQNNSGFLSGIPVVTKNLIIINLLFWVASITLPKIGVDLTSILGLHFFKASNFQPFQLISYMFMHDTQSIGHVFFNMFGVYMFGRVLENVWGPKRFLTFYLLTGIGAGIIQELAWLYDFKDLLSSGLDIVNVQGYGIMSKDLYLSKLTTVGASGAVFGILLAFAMLFPNVPLYIIFIPVPIKAKYFVVFYGIAELFMGVTNFGGGNIAHFAHLGGMLFGYILVKYWKKKDADNGRYFY